MLKSLQIISLLIGAVFVGVSASGQTTATFEGIATQGAKAPAYDIISVRPAKPASSSSMRDNADGVAYKNTTLKALMMGAYGVYRSEQIVGLPSWADSDNFDVEAKIGDETAAALQKLPSKERWEQRKLMMQALLADRFHLQVHQETRELPIYALVIAKGGLKLKEAPPEEASSMQVSYGSMTWQAMQVDSLTMNVANMVGRLVVNKTGLTAKYDMKLTWASDDMRGPMAQGGEGGAPQADSGPSIFTALEEQFGLKLESQKGPVPIVAVDHVERPSEN